MDSSPLQPRTRPRFPEPYLRARANQQGSLLEVKVNVVHSKTKAGGLRKGVSKYTRASRLRFLKVIARINWRRVLPGIFVTLTYPDEYLGRTYQERTQDRYLFLRAAEEEWGKPFACLWRIEWEIRKSGKHKGKLQCHQHFVLFKVRFLDKDWIKDEWRKILKRKGQLITWVEALETGKQAALYASKYAAKQTDLGVLDNDAYLNTTGRYWGVHRKPLVPWAKERKVDRLNAEQLNKAMHIGCTVLERAYPSSFTILSEDAQHMLCRILGVTPKELDAAEGRLYNHHYHDERGPVGR